MDLEHRNFLLHKKRHKPTYKSGKKPYKEAKILVLTLLVLPYKGFKLILILTVPVLTHKGTLILNLILMLKLYFNLTLNFYSTP